LRLVVLETASRLKREATVKVDWDKPADPAATRRATTILSGGAQRRTRSGLESTSTGGLESMSTGRPESTPAGKPESAPNPQVGGTDERQKTERLKEALRIAQEKAPPGQRVDDETIARVVSGAQTGMAKALDGRTGTGFSIAEHVGLEAVIITDGTRPCLFVEGGFITLGAPDVGHWRGPLSDHSDAVQRVIAGVGKITIPVGQHFAGTCFAIAPGLVCTNRHVLEEIAKFANNRWVLNWPSDTKVDFIGEKNRAQAKTAFPVTGVAFCGPNPINRQINFDNLDMAILKVGTDDGANTFPAALSFTASERPLELSRQVYVVGFPGEPNVWNFGGTPQPGHETQAVISELFHSKFGVKRLAPGEVDFAPGQVDGDAKSWVFVHDSSTLGGSSGSCVVSFEDGGERVVGLHFGGRARDQNWAHAIAKVRRELETHSGTFVA
jgi:hypothetical protein